ncbi:hypothetical protein [Paracidobacterium acidisoli]|uniref:O-antigen polysaccharide polymerase Wzy n=1 Tax=Paracidobacterium acidisoli TaxID=2303751 RepID=A0A372IRZ4_9BACT|nr:hypothetical protein [Paracidobacterium acidisoli]MBT9330416.1 hypothetical protein [Paracidobacterium acidisoli]
MSSMQIARPAYSMEARLQPPRALGEVFPPRRQRYILHLPLCLFLAAILSWIMPVEPMMVFACVVGSAISIYIAADWLLRRGPLRLSMAYTLALLFGYCLGTMNTWLTVPRGSFTLAELYNRDPAVLSRGVSSVLLAAGILLAVGELYEHPVFGEDFRITIDGEVYCFILVATMLIFAGFLTKRLTIGGISASVSGRVSPISELLLWLFFPLVAFAVSAFLATPRGLKKIVLGAISILLLLLLTTQTRRDQIYTGFLIVFAVRLSGYRVRGSLLKKTVLLFMLMFIVVMGTLSFELLRSIGGYGLVQEASIGERLSEAGKMIEEGTALSTALDMTRRNVTKRTFVLTFYADLLEASTHNTPAHGADLISQFEEALPHALFPEKTFLVEELLANQQFGMNNNDQPNSLITAGALDFGLLGAVFYPLLLIYLLRRFVEIAGRFIPNRLAVLFIALNALFLSLQTEDGPLSLVIMMRDSIILTVVLILFSSLFASRFRSRA